MYICRVKELDFLFHSYVCEPEKLISVLDTQDGIVEKYTFEYLCQTFGRTTGYHFKGIHWYYMKVFETRFYAFLGMRVQVVNNTKFCVDGEVKISCVADKKEYCILYENTHEIGHILFERGLKDICMSMVWAQKLEGYGYRVILRVDRGRLRDDNYETTMQFAYIYVFLDEDLNVYVERLDCSPVADVLVSEVFRMTPPKQVLSRLCLLKGTVL